MLRQTAQGVLWRRAPCLHPVSLHPAPVRCDPVSPHQENPSGHVSPGLGSLSSGTLHHTSWVPVQIVVDEIATILKVLSL